MKILSSSLARLLYGIPMIVFGVLHFVNSAMMAEMVPAFVPGGAALWVSITGVALLLAGLAIASSIFIKGLEKLVYWACILLGLMLIIFVLTMHLPAGNMPMILKDLGLAGGAWALARQFES